MKIVASRYARSWLPHANRVTIDGRSRQFSWLWFVRYRWNARRARRT